MADSEIRFRGVPGNRQHELESEYSSRWLFFDSLVRVAPIQVGHCDAPGGAHASAVTAVNAQASCSRSRSRATLCQLQSSRNPRANTQCHRQRRSLGHESSRPAAAVRTERSSQRTARRRSGTGGPRIRVFPKRFDSPPSKSRAAVCCLLSPRAFRVVPGGPEPVSERRILCRPCSDLSDAGLALRTGWQNG